MPAAVQQAIQGISPGLPGGVSAAYNVAAAAVLKSTPGIAATLICVAPGSAGSLTLNDTATVGGAASTNEFFSRLFSALAAGQVIPLMWPCAVGIVVSSVPTAGVFSIAFT